MTTDAMEETTETGFAGETVIHTENLSKRFGKETAVNQVNLDVPAGSIFGFVGPSGCGKTTTVRLLLGIYGPSAGAARVLDCSPWDFGRREREQIGYMPQLFVLYSELSVWENLNFAASLYGVSWRRKKRLHELLELVELTAHKDKLVREVSGGMRRRLSLIAALVHDPRLIFLDEPTAGIDPVLRRSFWDYFAELKREERTLFVTTQYVGEAAYCDYVGVMVNGRLLTVDTPLNLRRRALGGDVVELDTETYLSPDALNRLQRQNAVDAADIRRQSGHTLHLVVNDAGVAMPQILDWFQAEEIEVATISEYTPPFDDVFVKLVEEANDDPPQNDSE